MNPVRVVRRISPAFVLLLAGLLLGGCTVYNKAVISGRKAGQSRIETAEKTREMFNCKDLRRNYLFLEKTEVFPENVPPGQKINHRLKYALCPSKKTKTLRGVLTRRILYKGASIFRDRGRHEFNPGGWMVDAFITIPPKAEEGMYAVETVIEYEGKTLRDRASFFVKK